MKTAVIALLLNALCVSASPTFLQSSEASSVKSLAASSSSSSCSSSSSINYYSIDTCSAAGYNTIRDYLPTSIFDEVEQQFIQKKCEFLNSYSVYPQDISPLFADLTPERLNYDIILIGSTPAGLSAIPTLAALGKRILIVEKGNYPTAPCDSLYYRTSLYSSEYVNSYDAYINNDITKKIFTGNLLGGLSTVDYNTWNIGCKTLYDQLSEINEAFAWDKVNSYYQSLESYQSYSSSSSVSTSTSSSSSSSISSSASSSSSAVSSRSASTSTSAYSYGSSGTYSLYNSYRESFLSRTLSSVFNELNYSENLTPFDCAAGFVKLPIIGSSSRPALFPHTIFSSLDNTDNIDLALGTKVQRLLVTGGIATGIEVITPTGEVVTITANDQVIISTGPISTYQLLFNSGFGPQDLLSKFNIQPVVPIPYMGQNFITPAVYNGIVLKFPRGSLFNECGESDLRSSCYAFGDYEVSPSVSLSYYRAYLAVSEAQQANVALKFQAYSQSTLLRLKSACSSYYQYESYAQEYITGLVNDYDIIIVSVSLLAPRSKGYITYKDTIDTPYIYTGLLDDDYDVQCLLEAIEHTRALANTQVFSSLQCVVEQIPLQNFNSECFTEDFNRKSLLQYCVPSLYSTGAFTMGTEYQKAVVDKTFRVLGTKNLRLFSTGISSYSLYSESIAFSTLIGKIGSEFIVNEYNGQTYETISISNSAISSTSTSIESSSAYSAREIENSSSYISETNLNNIDIDRSINAANGFNDCSSIDYSSAEHSAASAEYSSHQASQSSYEAANSKLSSVSSNTAGIDSVGAYDSATYSSTASQKSYEAANREISSVSSNTAGIGSAGAYDASSYSASSKSYEAESAQESSYQASSLNGGSAVSQQSSSSSSSYAAEEEQEYNATSYSNNLNGGSLSSIESSKSSSSYAAAAEQSSQSISSAGIVAC